MKKPKYVTGRERAKQEEMHRQRIRASLIAYFPTDRLCDACKARDIWVDICPECRAKAEAYAGAK